MKHKRIWTDAQRAAAAERMNKARAVRMANLERARMVDEETPRPRVIAPEVQAVIDTMDPARRAKLNQIQQQALHRDPAAEAALARHEANKIGTSEAPFATYATVENPMGVPCPPLKIGEGVTVPPRPGSREVDLIVKNDGTMVSMFNECICGTPKRVWHAICLKEKPNTI